AGERLGEGEPFLVVVSEGPELRTLPDLTGLTLTDAETALARLQLVALPATDQFDETVPVGSVISWSVPSDTTLSAGGEVLPDTEVALVVSTGPAPRTIPTLVGLPVADATAQLAAIQLGATVGEPVFSDTVPTGNVVSATPDVGAQVPRDSTVALVPSKGVDLVVLPDLTGQTLDQVRASLGSAGLTVGSLLGTTAGTFQSASVLGEPAASGAQFKRGTAIDMVFL
ncbi:MAG: PASTA domain-containing protein, partial [Ilumatobacteraceae bacterium]